MLVWQRRTLAGSGSRPGIARSRVGDESRERLVHRRLLLAAEADRVVATVGHRRGVDDLAVDVRAVLETGESCAGLAHTERCACVELDAERDIETEAGRQLVQLSARAEDRPLGGPHCPRRCGARRGTSLAHAEDACGHEPVADTGCEAVDRCPDVDRAAELVEKRLVLGRCEDGERVGLLLAPDQASRHAGRLEGRRALGHVRSADENALATEQPRPELSLEPLPLGPRPNRKPNEPLVVMSMPKDPSAPGRLPGPGSSGLEANELNTAPLERVRRREPGDPGADDGDLCYRGAHDETCIPPGPRIGTARGSGPTG